MMDQAPVLSLFYTNRNALQLPTTHAGQTLQTAADLYYCECLHINAYSYRVARCMVTGVYTESNFILYYIIIIIIIIE